MLDTDRSRFEALVLSELDGSEHSLTRGFGLTAIQGYQPVEFGNDTLDPFAHFRQS